MEDTREQIWLVMEWVASSKGGEQPRWIVPPGTEEEHRKEALARARRLVQGERKQCLEVEEDPEGEMQMAMMASGQQADVDSVAPDAPKVSAALEEVRRQYPPPPPPHVGGHGPLLCGGGGGAELPGLR